MSQPLAERARIKSIESEVKNHYIKTGCEISQIEQTFKIGNWIAKRLCNEAIAEFKKHKELEKSLL